MNYPRSSSSIPSGYYNSFNPSPFTSRPVQNIVPAGTVASRIILLQSLATPSSPNVPRPLVHRRGENSRTGFGRRTSARFDKPASRISVPLECYDTLPEHSFLGHRTSRAHYMEAHAYENQSANWDGPSRVLSQVKPDVLETRVQYDGTSRLLSQLNPDGLETRVQYDATSPWANLLKSRSHRNPQLENVDQGQGSIREGKVASSLGNSTANNLSPPSACSETGRMSPRIQRDLASKLETQPRYRGSSQHKSDQLEDRTSMETTSSMRRQSVKDLYKEYRIRIPSGLVSSENLAFDSDETCRPQRYHRLCHICLRLNGAESECWRCGHQLCRVCDDLSPDSITERGEGVEFDINIPRGYVYSEQDLSTQVQYLKSYVSKVESKQQDVVVNNSIQRFSNEPEISQSHGIEKEGDPYHTDRLHSLGSQQYTPHDELTSIRPNRIEIIPPSAPPDPALVPNGLHKLQSKVVNSPFIIADRLSPTNSQQTIPLAAKITHHSIHRNNSTQTKDIQRKGPHRSSSLAENVQNKEFCCDSPGCRATHAGHRPYRHSISCTQLRLRNPDDTDSGYAASASHFDDHGNLPDSHTHSDHQHSHAKNETGYWTEYVGRHEYPRSDYVDNESLTSVYVVNKCLHDLNYSQCDACQSTHRSAVSCRDEDKRLVVRYHAPKKSKTLEKKAMTTSNSAASHPHGTQRSHRDLPAIKMIQVVMPTPRKKIYSPTWMTDASFHEPDKGKSKELTPETSRKIPHTKKLISKFGYINAKGLSAQETTITKVLSKTTELLPKATRHNSTVTLDEKPCRPPMKFGRGTLAELRAKWEQESVASLKESSKKRCQNITKPRRFKDPTIFTNPPRSVEPKPVRPKSVCPELNLKLKINLDKDIVEPQDQHNTSTYTSMAPPLRPNSSRVPKPPSLQSHSPVGVRRLSAFFESQGNGTVPVVNNNMPEPQGKTQQSGTIRRKNLIERGEMQPKQVTQQEKFTGPVLIEKPLKQQEEIQKVDSIRLTTFNDRFDKEGEDNRRLEILDEGSWKHRKQKLANSLSRKTESLVSRQENDACVHAARHVTTHNGVQDIYVSSEKHKLNGQVSHNEESLNRRLQSKPHGTAIKHGSAWAVVAIGDGKTQDRSEREVEDEENESFEFADMGIRGISIIIHLEDREDLVIKANLNRDS